MAGPHAGKDEGAFFSLLGKVKLSRQTCTSSMAVCVTAEREERVVMVGVSCISAKVALLRTPSHIHTHTEGVWLDGAFSVGVADGVDQWVGLWLAAAAAAAVAGPVRDHAVLLLGQQGGALARPVVRPGRGGALLGLGGVKVRGGHRRSGAGRGRGCLRQAGVVNGRGRGLRQLVPGAWRGHGRQRDGRVQPHVAALWGLGHAVQLGGQESVLVVGASDLHGGKPHSQSLQSPPQEHQDPQERVVYCKYVRRWKVFFIT